MHNVTRPVVLNVVFNGAGINPLVPEKELLTLGFNAVGEVKRSDFGLGKYVPIVGDETTITISAEFSKK
jgi:polyisoprenoid-binding protein YceI